MKRTLGVLIGLGIVSGAFYIVANYGSTVDAINETGTSAASTDAVAAPTAAELLEEATQKLILEAITASSTEIEAAKVQAAERVEAEMHREIERKVRLEIEATNTGALDKLEKELSF